MNYIYPSVNYEFLNKNDTLYMYINQQDSLVVKHYNMNNILSRYDLHSEELKKERDIALEKLILANNKNLITTSLLPYPYVSFVVIDSMICDENYIKQLKFIERKDVLCKDIFNNIFFFVENKSKNKYIIRKVHVVEEY